MINRVKTFYADRLERLERQGGVVGDPERADDTGLHRLTHDLLGRLLDAERAELQLMRNSAVIDGPVARWLQQEIDLLRLRERI